jgi:hypothetical protein
VTKTIEPDVAGEHDGFGGEAGTYILQDGQRIAVDPVTHKPLEPEQAQSAEKIKPKPEPVKKSVSDVDLTEK